MPKYMLSVTRVSFYEIEADSPAKAVDLYFSGDAGDPEPIDSETTEHAVYDEEGNLLEEDEDEDEDDEEAN